MASSYRYEDRILKAAREHFAAHGFYGARVDCIADEARLNKRMVYEYNHTKEGLYLSVLSKVSCDAMAMVDKALPKNAVFDDIQTIFITLFDILEKSDAFVRLWAWEQMATTIHGPRILETASSILERVKQIIRFNAQNGRFNMIPDNVLEGIEMMCHGYLLSLAIYLKNSQEADAKEIASPAYKRLNLSMEMQGMMLSAVTHYIETHGEK